MTIRDDELRVRPGRIRHGNQGVRRPKSFVDEVMRAAKKAGHTGRGFGRGSADRRPIDVRARPARGIVAVVALAREAGCRHGARSSASTESGSVRRRLTKHIAYLKREGVTRDGSDARMFDARSDDADSKAFAERCEDDRHHFRFTISPEDAARWQTCAPSRAS